jgi:hypothetical protein
MGKMTLQTVGDTHIVVTRRFAAASRGRIPRPHRSKVGPEMDARPGRLGDACLHQ